MPVLKITPTSTFNSQIFLLKNPGSRGAHSKRNKLRNLSNVPLICVYVIGHRFCLSLNGLDQLFVSGRGLKDSLMFFLFLGEYIFSLKTLRFDTFCRAIREKFSGVLWEQKLLCDLHHLINL